MNHSKLKLWAIVIERGRNHSRTQCSEQKRKQAFVINEIVIQTKRKVNFQLIRIICSNYKQKITKENCAN